MSKLFNSQPQNGNKTDFNFQKNKKASMIVSGNRQGVH